MTWGLEHLLRHCARPPFALKQFSNRRCVDGRIARVRYVLPRHKAATWGDPGRAGTSPRGRAPKGAGPLPELYYDPRSLQTGDARASLHAKCVSVDGERALITSANFTDAAQRKNIEADVVISHRPTVARLADYFAGLCSGDRFARCPLR